MFQGNWKCSKCGGAITELPFQPRSEAGLTCRACFMESKGGGSASSPAEEMGEDPMNVPAPDLGHAPEMPDAPDFDPFAGGSEEVPDMPPIDDTSVPGDASSTGQKASFTGDWKCSGCGAAITSLPFQPRSTNNLKCLDCFKQGK